MEPGAQHGAQPGTGNWTLHEKKKNNIRVTSHYGRANVPGRYDDVTGIIINRVPAESWRISLDNERVVYCTVYMGG